MSEQQKDQRLKLVVALKQKFELDEEEKLRKSLLMKFAIDGGATLTMFTSKMMPYLKNVHQQRSVYFTADGVKKVALMVGTHPVFGFGAIEENAIINLLSKSELKQRFFIHLDTRVADQYTLFSKTTMLKLEAPFDQRTGLYILEGVKNFNGYQYVFSRIDDIFQSSSISERVLALHEALHHPSKRRMMKAIRNGFFRNWEITEKS